MAFWKPAQMELEQFRPGIKSRVQFGAGLTMACLQIEADQEDPGHRHPFDQCGVVLAGEIQMSIGDQQRTLGPGEAYFIPAGSPHGWRTGPAAVLILDVTPRQDPA